jgi:hypothetical protein
MIDRMTRSDPINFYQQRPATASKITAIVASAAVKPAR